MHSSTVISRHCATIICRAKRRIVGLEVFSQGVVGHLQGAAVVENHPLKEPAHPVVFAGCTAAHAQRTGVVLHHCVEPAQVVGAA